MARALETLPRISAAFARAELSYSKVRAMTRVATVENEEELLVMGREGTASQLEKIVRGVLVSLCSHHHRAVHKQGFGVSRNKEGAKGFYLAPRRCPASVAGASGPCR